jgi:hypothetical protein
MRDREIPRGTIIGKATGGPTLSEAEHFWKCEACGGWFDMSTRSRCPIRQRIKRSKPIAAPGTGSHASIHSP